MLAEWEVDAPLREAMAIKRERLRALRAKRAAEQRSSFKLMDVRATRHRRDFHRMCSRTVVAKVLLSPLC